MGVPEEELLSEDSGAWLISDVPSGTVSPMGLAFQLDGKNYQVDFGELNAVTEDGSIVYSFRDLGITMLVYDYNCGKLLDTVDFFHTDGFQMSGK